MLGAKLNIPSRHQDDEPPLKPRRVQGLHADQPLDHPLSEKAMGALPLFSKKYSEVWFTGRLSCGCPPSD